MREKLSVIIPCLNERENLPGCLDTVTGFADEVIVADSGSVDGTQQIARQTPGCRLIEGEWIDYPTFKNWAIPQATHPWVLIVDADERVPPELQEEIREALRTADDSIDGFWIGFRSFFLGYELRYASYNTAALRLFRRDRCRYSQRRVHEEIEIAPERAGRLRRRILHYSIWSYDQYFDKYLKYTRMGAEEMAASGKRASLIGLGVRPFLRFVQMYVLRGGFRDGAAGLQMCMLTAFFNTFVKQARLWELQHAKSRDEADADACRKASREGADHERPRQTGHAGPDAIDRSGTPCDQREPGEAA